jgi:hypothetical protein
MNDMLGMMVRTSVKRHSGPVLCVGGDGDGGGGLDGAGNDDGLDLSLKKVFVKGKGFPVQA